MPSFLGAIASGLHSGGDTAYPTRPGNLLLESVAGLLFSLVGVKPTLLGLLATKIKVFV